MVRTSSALRSLAAALALLLAGTGCNPSDLVGNGELPGDVQDPKATQTRSGALAAYYGALITFRNATAGDIRSFVPTGGLLSDELVVLGPFNLFGDIATEATDRRVLPEFTDPASEDGFYSGAGQTTPYKQLYSGLQKARAEARVTRGLVRTYVPDVPDLVAHLYLVEGYADVFLADLFCSGIPLSTVEPDGYTLASGSTTAEVYATAAALFDSASAATTDSARFGSGAAVGRARVLLALGQFTEAGLAAAQVPDGFSYQLQFDATLKGENNLATDANFVRGVSPYTYGVAVGYTLANGEGSNGLDYVLGGDPRINAYISGYGFFSAAQYFPQALAADGSSPISIGDWKEARLIQAEAALQAGDVAGWLGLLNQLRQTAITPALPDLVDPGTPAAREDLLFRERAFWLILTGHRQGDLRRLIREYGRDPTTLYPVGVHPYGKSYGSDVTAPIPAGERVTNPRFSGCLNRGA